MTKQLKDNLKDLGEQAAELDRQVNEVLEQTKQLEKSLEAMTMEISSLLADLIEDMKRQGLL